MPIMKFLIIALFTFNLLAPARVAACPPNRKCGYGNYDAPEIGFLGFYGLLLIGKFVWMVTHPDNDAFATATATQSQDEGLSFCEPPVVLPSVGRPTEHWLKGSMKGPRLGPDKNPRLKVDGT